MKSKRTALCLQGGNAMVKYHYFLQLETSNKAQEPFNSGSLSTTAMAID